MKQKIEKWQAWIKRIEDEIMRLMLYRSYNRNFERIVNDNPNLHASNGYLRYFRSIYADHAAMAIRRQAKGHKDAISLRDLLEDLKENPTVLSHEWLQEFYTQPGPTGSAYPRDFSDFLADTTYQQFADQSGKFMDPTKIGADIDELEQQTERVVTYTDRALAHDEKGGPKLDAPLSFNEIDAAIQVIEKLVTKYTPLLTGASFIGLTPVDQTDDIEVFHRPWVEGTSESR